MQERNHPQYRAKEFASFGESLVSPAVISLATLPSGEDDWLRLEERLEFRSGRTGNRIFIGNAFHPLVTFRGRAGRIII